MRFSDDFLRQVRDRVSIADYAGRRLSWNKQKTRASSGDYWACCPFHQEKTPSFHVLDRKGLFNCFGCGEKGDLFGLAMKLEGLSFPEAVAQMAERAGVPLPRDEREDSGAADQRKRLYAVTARAAELFREALRSSGGAEARRYLQGRGLGPEVWERFGIGLAPDEWTWGLDKLKAAGFSLEEIIAAGLAREGEDGRRAIDTFRNRITFEICDPAGKTIGFGARALAKEAKAKYINSPETALYSKSRVLYRLKQARELAAKTKADGLVVGEGYLDVIAFERAGVAAVAPCGTALTDEQLQLLWRAGTSPILCFDGDAAGQRAADRALDLALPHLGPSRTLRFARAPAGEDPDDIFRRGGAEALAHLAAAAAPASDFLFEREKGRHGLTTPESKAAFQAALKAAANAIADPDTRQAYFGEMMARANDALRAGRPLARQSTRPDRRDAPAPPTAELKALAAARSPRPAIERLLEAALDHPFVLEAFGEWIGRLEVADADLEAIRAAILLCSDADEGGKAIDRVAVSHHLLRLGKERAAARLARWSKPSLLAPSATTRVEWLAQVTREVVLPAIREELGELRERAGDGDAGAFVRFQALSREIRDIEARARQAKLEEAEESQVPDGANASGAPNPH